ncbi:reverse transcriptase domain-containing protein [Tanacetum coccineum]
MAGPTEGGGLEGQHDREATPPPLTKEEIERHLSALKSIIQDHNRRNKTDPVRLDFELEDTKVRDNCIVKGKEVIDEDLKKPFKETLKKPLTRRIIEFTGPEYKMPTNIKLYDRTTDPKDHLSRFANAANSGEWPMPDLREAFAARYTVRRACFKEPHEITKIVRKANESLTAFKERWKVETGFIMGVLEVMKISSCMDSVKSPELTKCFSNKVPVTVNEMMVRLDNFVRSEEAYARTELPKGETEEHHRKPSLLAIRKDDRLYRNNHTRDLRRNDNRSNYKSRDTFVPHRGRVLNNDSKNIKATLYYMSQKGSTNFVKPKANAGLHMASNGSITTAQPMIPIFYGEKYEFWSVKMKTLFKSQDLWDLVENGFANDAQDEQRTKENKKKDSKTLLFIQQAMHDSIFSRIVAAETSKETWEILQNEFKGSTKVITVKLQTLRREFKNLNMKSLKSAQDYLSRVSTLVNKMKSYGDQINEEGVVSKVLRSLSSKFNHVVAAIKEAHDLSSYSFDELMSSLLAHEERLNSTQKRTEEKVFQVRGDASSKRRVESSNFRGNNRCGYRGRGRGQCRGEGRSESDERQNRNLI